MTRLHFAFALLPSGWANDVRIEFTDGVIDASAAASCTKIFNMAALPELERMQNIVPFLF